MNLSFFYVIAGVAIFQTISAQELTNATQDSGSPKKFPGWYRIYKELQETELVSVNYKSTVKDIIADLQRKRSLRISVTIEDEVGGKEISISKERITVYQLLNEISLLSKTAFRIENHRIAIGGKIFSLANQILKFRVAEPNMSKSFSEVLPHKMIAHPFEYQSWFDKENSVLFILGPVENQSVITSVFHSLGLESVVPNDPF